MISEKMMLELETTIEQLRDKEQSNFFSTDIAPRDKLDLVNLQKSWDHAGAWGMANRILYEIDMMMRCAYAIQANAKTAP